MFVFIGLALGLKYKFAMFMFNSAIYQVHHMTSGFWDL